MKKLHLMVIIILLWIPNIIKAYPWPIKNSDNNFNGPFAITGTFGDARGSLTDLRFHWGIDIQAINGTSVYSLESGIAYQYGSIGANAYVVVDNIWYIHLQDENRIGEGRLVTGIIASETDATIIGYIRDYLEPGVSGDHLHFQIGDSAGPKFNPLNYTINQSTQPDNYDDTGLPIVWNSFLDASADPIKEYRWF